MSECYKAPLNEHESTLVRYALRRFITQRKGEVNRHQVANHPERLRVAQQRLAMARNLLARLDALHEAAYPEDNHDRRNT